MNRIVPDPMPSSRDEEALVSRLRAAGVEETEAAYAVERMREGDARPLLRLTLLLQLWEEVLDPDGEHPFSVGRWRELGDAGFPFLDAAAAERALAAGAAVEDLNAIVRSAQILTLYNAANTLDRGTVLPDGPVREEDLDGQGWELALRRGGEESDAALGELHSELEGLDPTGRYGMPTCGDEARLAAMPRDVQSELLELIGKPSKGEAAILWHRTTGDDLEASRAIVRRLGSRPWITGK